MRRQPRKVSRLPPALTSRWALEPGDHPHDIQRGGSEQVLEVGAREAEIATLAELKAPDALRVVFQIYTLLIDGASLQ